MHIRRVLILATLTTAITAQDFGAGIPFTPIGNLNYWFREDLTGNGVPDYARAVYAGGAIEILEDPGSNPATGYAVPRTIAAPQLLQPAYAMGSYDHDNNGIRDLIVRSAQTTWYVLPSLGGGNYGALVQIPMPWFSGMSERADFNGDGAEDFVIRNYGAQPSSGIYLHLNGTYVLAHIIQGYVVGEASGDFNGDGYDDYVYTTNVIHNNGVAHFVAGGPSAPFGLATPIQISATAQNVFFRDAADFNGDGIADLLFDAWNAAPPSFGVALGDPVNPLAVGTSTAIPPGPSNMGPIRAHVTHVNADTLPDVMVWYLDPPTTQAAVRIVRGDGTGGVLLPWVDAWSGTGFLMAQDDADGDGDSDLVVLTNPAASIPPGLHVQNDAIFGDGCQGVSGIPRISTDLAMPGNLGFHVRVADAAPGRVAFGLVALNRAAQANGCGPLLDLSPTSLLVVPQLGIPFVVATSALGDAAVPVPLPLGLPPIGPLYVQWAIEDPQGSFALPGLSLSASRAAILRIY